MKKYFDEGENDYGRWISNNVGIAYLVWYEAHAKLDFTWSLFGTALTFLVVQGMHVAGYKHIKESLVEKTEMKSNDN